MPLTRIWRSSRWALLWLLASGGLALALASLVEPVPPDHAGVRRGRFGGGFADRDFPTGWHLDRPGLDSWEQVPNTERWLVFGMGRDQGLELRTRDDNPATLDVAVLYSVLEGQQHRVVQDGLESSLESRVRATVEDRLRSTLAALESEQWFQSDGRIEISRLAQESLDAALLPLHTQARQVLIGQIAFSKEFEKKLQEKRLAFQAQRRAEAQLAVDAAKNDLLAAKQVTSRAVAEVQSRWKQRRTAERTQAEQDIAQRMAAGNERIAARQAEAEAAYTNAVAEGERALEEARAATERGRLSALGGPGGAAFLTIEAARNLQLKTLHFDPRFTSVPLPLDLDAWLALLTPGAQGG